MACDVNASALGITCISQRRTLPLPFVIYRAEQLLLLVFVISSDIRLASISENANDVTPPPFLLPVLRFLIKFTLRLLGAWKFDESSILEAAVYSRQMPGLLNKAP